MTAAAFWEMTPAELAAALDAYAWRQRQAQRQAVQTAWLTAALGRAKRMPTLAKLLTGPARKLHGAELRQRRAEFKRAASAENVAAINRHMQRMSDDAAR